MLDVVPPPRVEIEDAPARELCGTAGLRRVETKLDNQARSIVRAVARILDAKGAKFWRGDE